MSRDTSMHACPNCDSEKIAMEKRIGGWFHCQDCHYSWQPYPVKFGFDVPPRKPTVFDHITESLEALAEKFVYHIYLTDCLQRKRSYWRSTFFPCNNFSTKEKAIAATIEELKKKWKENE